MIQQKKINSFIKSITDNAAQKREAVGTETEQILSAERQRLEGQARQDAENYIKLKEAALKLETGKRISEEANERRKEVFSKRSMIAEKTFSDVAEKLKMFTKGPEYKEFLLKSAGEVLHSLAADADGATLMVRHEDLVLGDELCKKFPGVAVIEADDIKIGGVKGMNSEKTLLIDDTLDSRLEGQKRWFEENSGLYIKMR